MHHKASHEGNGRIVKGKLVVEGQENSVRGGFFSKAMNEDDVGGDAND